MESAELLVLHKIFLSYQIFKGIIKQFLETWQFPLLLFSTSETRVVLITGENVVLLLFAH